MAKTGEWGHCIVLQNGSKNIKLSNINISDCWGDGIYIRNAYKISIYRVKSNNNRRQGMSIVGGGDINVSYSTFSNTNGADPQSGIDIEPNKGNFVKSVIIYRCNIFNNYGDGIMDIVPSANSNLSRIDDVKIIENNIYNNGFASTPKSVRSGIEINISNNQDVKNNFIYGNIGYGLIVGWSSVNVNIKGNKIMGNSDKQIIYKGYIGSIYQDNVIRDIRP